MPFLVKLALFRTEVAHAQGCPVPAELRTEEWSWWMGDAGGAAGCQLPLARAQQEIPGVQLPNIRSKLAGFLKSCTGWRGTWKTGVFLMLRGRRKQANLISKLREAVALTDGPGQGQQVCSQSIHCCWWEATLILFPAWAASARGLWSGILVLPGLTFTLVEEVCSFLQGFLYSGDSYHHEVSSESPRNTSASNYGGTSGKFCAISLLSIQ